MHRERDQDKDQNKEAQPSTFTETAFKKRFGLALLASLGLHAALLAFAPGIPAVATPAGLPVIKTLTVGLASRDERPDQTTAAVQNTRSTQQPQATRQPLTKQQEQAAERVSPPEIPDIQKEADRPQAPAGQEAQQTQHAPQVPLESQATQVPQASHTTQNPPALHPDVQRIGEEYKKALMDLLAYPEAARRRGVQGTVGLRIAMDAAGHVEEVVVSQTSGSSILDKAAVAAALAAPGPLAGPGRRLELTLRISFQAGRVLAGP
ncbi:MAG: TonB family protein [Spirochaetia bacterium]|jgi:protein TonB|nr:TonB family protein [Spirochaetia bacterium]